MNKQQFEDQYIIKGKKDSKTHKDNFKVVPCKCNNPICSGFQFVMKNSKHEDK